MADRGFPLGLAGLVHVRNRIVAHRPVDAAEILSLRSSARALRPHPLGAQVDLVGRVRVGEELVWEGVSTYLARAGAAMPGGCVRRSGRETACRSGRPGRPEARCAINAVWDVPGDMGRRYASVSGDVDPMHLSTLAAKAFGFPRILVQGMWTKAHALAAIEARLPAAYAVDVAFSRPLPLPSVANFLVEQRDQGGTSRSGRGLRGSSAWRRRPLTGPADPGQLKLGGECAVEWTVRTSRIEREEGAGTRHSQQAHGTVCVLASLMVAVAVPRRSKKCPLTSGLFS